MDVHENVHVHVHMHVYVTCQNLDVDTARGFAFRLCFTFARADHLLQCVTNSFAFSFVFVFVTLCIHFHTQAPISQYFSSVATICSYVLSLGLFFSHWRAFAPSCVHLFSFAPI